LLKRLRRDATYGAPPASGQPSEKLDEKGAGVVVPPRENPTRMRPILPSFGQRALIQRMTAAERAFMDIRRGSSD
jgi:hypothetical protein